MANCNSMLLDKDFKVTYRVEAKSLLVKPLLFAGVVFGFLIVFIASFRMELEINKTRARSKSSLKED